MWSKEMFCQILELSGWLSVSQLVSRYQPRWERGVVLAISPFLILTSELSVEPTHIPRRQCSSFWLHNIPDRFYPPSDRVVACLDLDSGCTVPPGVPACASKEFFKKHTHRTKIALLLLCDFCVKMERVFFKKDNFWFLCCCHWKVASICPSMVFKKNYSYFTHLYPLPSQPQCSRLHSLFQQWILLAFCESRSTQI